MNLPALTALLDDWFGASTPLSARTRFAALGTLVDIAEGTVVVREGLPCPALGVLTEGRIALRMGLPGGDARTILTIDPGDMFGWSAVLPPFISTSTGIAVAPSRAIMFDGESLRAALAMDCELAAAVYKRLLVGVARRLTSTRVQLLDLYRPAGEPW